MGFLGNLFIFLISLPFTAWCVNKFLLWKGVEGFLSDKAVTLITHPALMVLSIVALVFGVTRVFELITRKKFEKRELEAERIIDAQNIHPKD